MEFTKFIGSETNAAILDLELVTKNPKATLSDSYVIRQFINNINEVINDDKFLTSLREIYANETTLLLCKVLVK